MNLRGWGMEWESWGGEAGLTSLDSSGVLIEGELGNPRTHYRGMSVIGCI